MTEWRFKKRIGNIIFEEFQRFFRQFHIVLKELWQCDTEIKITLYKGVPRCSSHMGPENKWMEEENKKRILKEITDFNELTEEMFNQSIFARVIIKPKDKNKDGFGSMDCKGLLSDCITFEVRTNEKTEFIKEVKHKTSPVSRNFSSVKAGMGLRGQHIHLHLF